MHCCSPSWKQRKFLQTNILERLKNHSENATTGEQHRGRQRSDSADSHAVVFPGSRIQLLALKITFSPIQKTHTGTTLSVCVFLFAIFLKNYLTNRKTYAIIKVLCEFFTVRGVTQLGRVLALGARCRRFESCRLDQRWIAANTSPPDETCRWGFFYFRFPANFILCLFHFSFFILNRIYFVLTWQIEKTIWILPCMLSFLKKRKNLKKIAWHFRKAVI